MNVTFLRPNDVRQRPAQQPDRRQTQLSSPELARDRISFSGLRLIANGLTPFQRYRLELLTGSFRSARNEQPAAAERTAAREAHWSNLTHGQLPRAGSTREVAYADWLAPVDEPSWNPSEGTESLLDPLRLARLNYRPMLRGFTPHEPTPFERFLSNDKATAWDQAEFTPAVATLDAADEAFPETQFLGRAQPIRPGSLPKKPAPRPCSKPTSIKSRPVPAAVIANFVRLSDTIIQPRLAR